MLTFDYDVDGRFSDPFITGRAAFAESEFLGATVGAGTVGSIDTLSQPIRYTGEGDVSRIELRQFGEGLDVAWLRDPKLRRHRSSGHFHVEASGTSAATLTLTGGGRLTSAEIFKGVLSDADVSVEIADGTLKATYDGRLDRIDPSIPFEEPRIAASLTGTGKLEATVRELLTRTTPMEIADYDVSGTLALRQSTLRDIELDTARVVATLRDSIVTMTELQVAGPALEGRGSGRLVLSGDSVTSDLQYELVRGDLAKLGTLAGYELAGTLTTKGRVTGPYTALRATGDATINQLQGFSVSALAFTGQYDVTVPSGDAVRGTARLTGRGEFLTLAGQAVQTASGTVTYDAKRLGFDIRLSQTATRTGQLAGAVMVDTDKREATILELAVNLGKAPWRLTNSTAPPVVSWSDKGIAVTTAEFVDNNNDERIVVGGTWLQDGSGALRVTATHVFLDTLQAAFDAPTRYGGVLDFDATITGTRSAPRVTGTVAISNGRVQRVSYQKLAGRFTYTGRRIDIDFRLDQGPGTWITAVGDVPLSLFNPQLIDEPIDVEIKSSTISLGLIEGVTSVVREVGGELTIDVRAVGTSRDPHVAGRVDIRNAKFLTVASGSRYKNVRAALALAADKVTVESLHVEDADGDSLDVHGSLGTHELRVGDLEMEVTAHRFEVMRNNFGRVDVDAAVEVRGRWEAPRIAGIVTIDSGTLQVDEILVRTLFQPYSTEETAITDVDPVAALNPWDRLGLDLFAARAEHAEDGRRQRAGVAGHADRAWRHQPAPDRRPLPLQGSGPADLADRIVRLDLRHLLVPGTPLRCHRGELDQLPRRSEPRDLRDGQPRHLRRRNARQHLRAAPGAGAAAGERAAAGSVGHPLADSLQHVDQPAVGGAAGAAGGARRNPCGRVPRAADPHGDRIRVRPRHLRDRPGRVRLRSEGDHRRGSRARADRTVQPAVRHRGVRRGDDRVLPVAPVQAARDLLRRAVVDRALPLPAGRTRRDRLPPLFQFLSIGAARAGQADSH